MKETNIKDLLIKKIADKSETPQHELLVDFLEKNNLNGLIEAKPEQLQEYIDKMEENNEKEM